MERYTLILRLPGGGTQVLVRDGPTRMGRHPDCDLHLPHPLVSRQHARVELDNGVFSVTDLDSRNGTLVNGRLLNRDSVAVSGDLEIEIGPFAVAALRGDSDTRETMLLDVPIDKKLSGMTSGSWLAVDRSHRRARVRGELVGKRLSPQEYQFLEVLCGAAPDLVEASHLGDAIWGAGAWEPYMLHNLARRVRQKVGHNTGVEALIITVPGAGYRVADGASD